MAQFDSIRFQPGRPLLRELSAERLNTVLTEIRRNKPKGERGITVRQDGTGTYIGLAAALPRGGSSAPATSQPWDLTASVDPNDETKYLVRVRPGTLNGLLPSNWDEEFICNNTGLYYAKAVTATDGQDITGVTIAIDTTAPANQQAVAFGVANPVEYLFGIFLEGACYRVIGNGHITISPKLWLTTDRDTPPAAGQLPFTQYFSLR